MQNDERRSRFVKGVDNLQKYTVLGSALILFLLVLALFFIQQMVAAQGRGAEGFYDFFGGHNIAGLMMAVPVTIGLGLQIWRLRLYIRGVLSGQWPDYVVTLALIVVSVGVELYVFNSSPVKPISPQMPRIVISAYLVAHVLQTVVEFLTDWYHKAGESQDSKHAADDVVVSSFRPSAIRPAARTRHEDGREEAFRESVSPKGRS